MPQSDDSRIRYSWIAFVALLIGLTAGFVTADQANAEEDCSFTYCDAAGGDGCDPTSLDRNCILNGPFCRTELCE